MALPKKTQFQLDVLKEYGVMPLFDGREVPGFVDGPVSPSERFGPWCRRVLEREPSEVTVLSDHCPDPRASVSKLAVAPVADALRATLTEHRNLGKETTENLLGDKLEAALAENTTLKEKIRTLTVRNDRLEDAARKRSLTRNARSKAAEREVVAASLREFLEEESSRLEDIVISNGLEAAQRMLDSGNVNAGYWMLFNFINQRCKMR